DTQEQARGSRAAAQNANVEELHRKNASLQVEVNKLSEQLKEARTVEYRRLQADRDSLRFQNRELREQLVEAKKPRSESQEVAKWQRQLKAMKTRLHNLTLEKNTEWRAAIEARDANPAVITKANLNKLRKVFHPDLEARVSQERKAELTAASQIFNRLKFKVI